MREQHDKARYRYAFDNMRELGQWLIDTPKTWPSNNSQDHRASNSWDLGLGYQGAVELARKGWIEGAQRSQESLKRLSVSQPQPRLANDVHGFRPHVPRYCAGAPDHMVRHDGDMGGGQSLCLYVSICAPSITDAQAMANYGVAVAQYVKQLELEGTRCEVHCVSTTHLHGVLQTFAVRLKSAGQPLDLASLAFAIGHPAMLRRLEFAFCERAKGRYDTNYGGARDTTLADLIDPPAGAVIVNGMRDANRIAATPERALESLSSEINRKQKKE